VPAFLLVAMIAMTVVMSPVMRFVGRTGTGEGWGGFQGQDHRYYVRSFLKKVTSWFICRIAHNCLPPSFYHRVIWEQKLVSINNLLAMQIEPACSNMNRYRYMNLTRTCQLYDAHHAFVNLLSRYAWCICYRLFGYTPLQVDEL